MSRLVSIFVIGAVLASAATVDIQSARPEEVGLSTERLARVRAMIQGYIDREQIAGAVALIARRGRVAYFEAQGFADLESGKRMQKDNLFRIASMTKPIASVAAMMLLEEGRISLNDPVSRYIPEFKDPRVAMVRKSGETGEGTVRTVPADREITIRHLLTHTAGLPNTYGGLTMDMLSTIARKPDDTVGDYVKRLATLPLNFHPGTGWEYGPATDVVGRVVEVASGMTLDEFLNQRIFSPLGMSDTHFYPPEAKLSRVATNYVPKTTERGITPVPRPAQVNTRYFSGAGGLSSTAADYLRFCQMSLNGGELNGARLLSRKSVEAMTVNHIGDLKGWLVPPGARFGLGYAVLTDLGEFQGLGSVGSYWWGGAFGTTFWIDPKEQMIGIMMIQLRPYSHIAIRSQFRTLATQAIVD